MSAGAELAVPSVAAPEPYYSDDLVTLFLGDCREVTAWLKADVLVTDPPYGIAWTKGDGTRDGRTKRSRSHDGIVGDEDTSVRDSALAVWGNRPAVVFGSLYAPQPEGVRHVGVWEKPLDAGIWGHPIGMRRDLEALWFVGDWPKRKNERGSVFRSGIRNVGNPTSPAGRYGHPHAKPVDLIEQLLALCAPGVIADPFAGSGSTLVAARNLGRKAIGVEIDEAYAEKAARRLSQGVLL